MTLLLSKVRPPGLHPTYVPRARLIERLDEGLRSGHRLALLCAPAGYGKTALLVHWLKSLKHSVAWLSLEDGDGEDGVFYRYLSLALDRAGVGPVGPLAVEHSPLDHIHIVECINRIEASRQPLVLVLDDLHVISSDQIFAALTFLLDHQPENLHLVLATRADPTLPVARYRAKGLLTELRADDLRFTAQEVDAFLNERLQLGLETEELRLLDQRIEGWVAGLKLAALSMRGREDKSAFIRGLAGTHAFILEYLAAEALQHQPDEIQRFLHRTCILDRLSGPLCDAVTGETGGEDILRRLYRENLFLWPIDNDQLWFTYHPLFADLLNQQLRERMRAEEIGVLHQRAAGWFAARGELPQAIKHAMAAGDHEQAASLIEAAAAESRLDSRLAPLLRWVEALPREVLAGRPRLSVYYAGALFLDGQRARFRREMERARTALEALPPSQAAEARFLGDIAAALEGLAEALALALEGRLEASVLKGREVLELAERTGVGVLSTLALEGIVLARVAQGRLYEAMALCDEIAALAGRLGAGAAHQLPLASMGLIERGKILLEWNELEAAAGQIDKAITLSLAGGGTHSLVEAHLLRSRLLLALGNLSAAEQSVRQAESFSQLQPPTSLASYRLTVCQMWLDLHRGDADQTLRRAAVFRAHFAAPEQDRELPILLHEGLQILTARAFLAQGQAQPALDVLAPLLAPARDGGRLGRVLEITWLLSLAKRALGDDAGACTCLAESLSLAHPQGYARTYLDGGARAAEILAAFVATAEAPEAERQYARKLLSLLRHVQVAQQGAPHAAPGKEPMAEALTRRELEVLELISAGLSNQEIAETLVVSLNTVKRHTSNLYGKLGVSNRGQAIAQARRLGMLTDPRG